MHTDFPQMVDILLLSLQTFLFVQFAFSTVDMVLFYCIECWLFQAVILSHHVLQKELPKLNSSVDEISFILPDRELSMPCMSDADLQDLAAEH